MSSPRERVRAAIIGIAGTVLGDSERAALCRWPPAGVILFRRNVASPDQLTRLTVELRGLLPEEAVVMVDQEGGRVARLRPPHWTSHPSAAEIGALHQRDEAAGLRAAWLHGALIGAEAADAGFDVVTAPVLDLRWAGASDVIGDRSFGADAQRVAVLGRAMAEGLLAAGVQPVGKHAPGHGQARADSHVAMPVVPAPAEADLAPFRANRDLPWMMTAHVLYPDLDPDQPATLSARIVGEVIRGTIGFGGVLVSDDLAMGALSGTPPERALAALAAGCDLALYCPGDPEGTEAVLRACPLLTSKALERMAAARGLAAVRKQALDLPAIRAERGRLMGEVGP